MYIPVCNLQLFEVDITVIAAQSVVRLAASSSASPACHLTLTLQVVATPSIIFWVSLLVAGQLTLLATLAGVSGPGGTTIACSRQLFLA